MALRLQHLKGQRFYEALPEADAQFHERTGQHYPADYDPFQQDPHGQVDVSPLQQQQSPYEPVANPESLRQRSPFPVSPLPASTQQSSPGADISGPESLYAKSIYDSKSLRAASFATQETQYAPGPPPGSENAAAPLVGGANDDGMPPAHWKPQRLQVSMAWRLTRLAFDILSAAVALLFTAYGFLVLNYDGKSADPGTMGWKLYEVSQYAPTIFPVIFAGLVGNSMKSIITWRLQNPGGATVRTIEQFIGSQSMLRAFMTQFRLRALNPLGIFTIILWCLSPLGSQASLRVITIEKSYPTTSNTVAGLYNFGAYGFGIGLQTVQAETQVGSPVVASIIASPLLAGRNQDLWGNIRFPAIELLESASNSTANSTGVQGSNTTSTGSWMTFDEPANSSLTYPSLVGEPAGLLPSSGNTSFVLPGSYMKLTCPVFGKHTSDGFTNLSSAAMTALLPEDDCSWSDYMGGTRWQIAITTPCNTFYQNMNSSNTRQARKFFWESVEAGTTYTRAECHLTTTFVEANVTCTGSSSGLSAHSECQVTHVRRANPLGLDSNWTMLDYGTMDDAVAVIYLLTELFPSSESQSGNSPVANYLTDPNTAVAGYSNTPVYTAGRETFEMRMAQLLNSVASLGSNPTDLTGLFNVSEASRAALKLHGNVAMLLEATTSQLQDVVQCSRPWLGVLVVASLGAFALAIVAAGFRMVTIIPDVVESVALAFLPNRTHGMYGSSTWSATQWVLDKKNVRVGLADICPGAEVGCIALTPLDDGTATGKAQVGKMYL